MASNFPSIYCTKQRRHVSLSPAFPKLWSADHRWSSGSALVVLLDWTLVKKKDRKNKINVNFVSHTVVENLKQFDFKADKSRAVRRTFWLIKVGLTWKKFGIRCLSQYVTTVNTTSLLLTLTPVKITKNSVKVCGCVRKIAKNNC
jgi:hypothetical protein